MTTATPTPTGVSAAKRRQTGDKQWNGPVDREDPEIDEKARPPRGHAAVAEATSQFRQEGVLEMLARTIVALHDWLAGPPTSAQDKIKHDLAEHRDWPLHGPMGGA